MIAVNLQLYLEILNSIENNLMQQSFKFYSVLGTKYFDYFSDFRRNM